MPDCPICLESLDDTTTNYVITNCNHCFHCTCFVTLFENRDNDDVKCPLCRVEILTYKTDDSSSYTSTSYGSYNSGFIRNVFSGVENTELDNKELENIIKNGTIEDFKANYNASLYGKSNINGSPMLETIINMGKVDFAEHIIEMDKSLETSCIARQFEDGSNPLFWAIRYPNLVQSIVDIFKKNNFDIDTQDTENNTALIQACSYFRTLNSKRYWINSRNKDQPTTLEEDIFNVTGYDANLLIDSIGIDKHKTDLLINYVRNFDTKSACKKLGIDYEDEDEDDEDEDDEDEDDEDEEDPFYYSPDNNFKTIEDVYKAELTVFETVKILINNGANVNINEDRDYDNDELDDDFTTPFIQACGGGFLDLVKLLAEEGADVNILDGYDMTPLMVACNIGSDNKYSEDILRFLVSHKDIDIDKKDRDNHTALWNCVDAGNIEVSKILIDAGANINTYSTNQNRFQLGPDYSPDKNTLLMKAIEIGSCDMVNFLIKKGVDTSEPVICNGTKSDYLRYPVETQHTDMLKVLLKNNIGDVNAKLGYLKMTPLMTAAQHFNLNMTKLLLSYGAKKDVKNKLGESLIDILNNPKQKCLDTERKLEIINLIYS